VVAANIYNVVQIEIGFDRSQSSSNKALQKRWEWVNVVSIIMWHWWNLTKWSLSTSAGLKFLLTDCAAHKQLPLLLACKLVSSSVSLKFCLFIILHRNQIKTCTRYLGNWFNTASDLSQKLSFASLFILSTEECSFRTTVSHQRPVKILWHFMTNRLCTFNVWLVSDQAVGLTSVEFWFESQPDLETYLFSEASWLAVGPPTLLLSGYLVFFPGS
jgi:hypothetical protein